LSHRSPYIKISGFFDTYIPPKNKGGLKGLKIGLIISHYLIDTKNAILIIKVMKIIKININRKVVFYVFRNN